MAMYRAKASGGNGWALFDESLRAPVRHRLDLERELRHALEHGEFRLFYQPEVDLSTREIMGAEALLRWEHPERGILAPAEFLGVAEETGLIVPIGTWVIEEACRDAARWAREQPFVMWVNLSGRQFLEPDLVQQIANAAERAQLEMTHLAFEITESILIEDSEQARAVIDGLRSLGARLCIDDFGTGYSSLTYLRRFPIDCLKIDQTFIDGLGEEPDDTAIVTATIGMAHALGLRVHAEGVETPEQFAGLRALRCDFAQGFYIARPQPAAEFDVLLASNPRW